MAVAERARSFVFVGLPADRAALLSRVLLAANDQLHACGTAQEAVHRVHSQPVDLVVIPADLPDLPVLELISELRQLDARQYAPILVLANGDRRIKLEALRAGADDVLEDPLDLEELAARAERCLQSRRRIDQLVEEANTLHALSITDGLTQLFNHRFFQDRLKDEFRRSQRYGDPLAVILLDLDHFKQVNDQHGHVVGDQVLREVAGVLHHCVRETDFLCRYGGEEFCALLPKTHFAGALTVAERIWREMKGHPFSGGLQVTASVGVSSYPARGVGSAEQLLRTADDALYRAKREGRNRICLYSQVAMVESAKAI